MDDILFSARFSYLADETFLNDAELGEALGVSKSTIGSWRYGSRRPRPDKLKDIASYFGVTPEWLSGQPEAEKFPVS